jgi:hypothetical protein
MIGHLVVIQWLIGGCLVIDGHSVVDWWSLMVNSWSLVVDLRVICSI